MLLIQLGGFCYVLAFFLFNYPVWKCAFGHKILSPDLAGEPWVLGQWLNVLTTWTSWHLSYCKTHLPASPLCPPPTATVTCPAKVVLLRKCFLSSSSGLVFWQADVLIWLSVHLWGPGCKQVVWSADLTGSKTASSQEAWSKLDLSWLQNTLLNFGLYF